MRIVIHQPEFLPWLGYFNKVSLCDLLVIEDDVQYRSQGFQNRNLIKTPMGPQWLTVPVERHDSREKISKVRIINRIEHGNLWHERHLRTMQVNYGKAPFYDEYVEILRSIYSHQWELLADLNIALLRALFKVLAIDLPVKRASELDIDLSKNERIIEICKRNGADTYVTGRGGLNYLNQQLFADSGINVLVHKYEYPQYSQRFMKLGFIPNLSIVDLLFNHGPASRGIMESSHRNLEVVAR